MIKLQSHYGLINYQEYDGPDLAQLQINMISQPPIQPHSTATKYTQYTLITKMALTSQTQMSCISADHDMSSKGFD